MEPTCYSNYPEIQKNINGLSDSSSVEQGNPSTQIVQHTENNELRLIKKKKNGVNDNVDTILTIFNSRH